MQDPLSNEELKRYARHIRLPEVGLAGQERLKAASVLLIGVGGLGSPVALYLAAAGVGTLGLVDFDRVDESNLQRQILYSTDQVDAPKTDAARDRLLALNPHLTVNTHPIRLTHLNALPLFRRYDVIVDGSDNFGTRYLVNDACILTGKPNVYGSIHRFEGQVTVLCDPEGPCYRCLYPNPPEPGLIPSCADAGVLGVLPGLIGTLQATEVLKLILGLGEPLVGRLLLVDALDMRFLPMEIPRNPQCAVCGDAPTQRSLVDTDVLCGQVAPPAVDPDAKRLELTCRELKALLDAGKTPFLLDVRSPGEFAIVHLPGSSLIPLSELRRRTGELDRTQPIITVCHHGIRSLQALGMLQQAGFSNVRSLKGGIDAWALDIDPSMPRY